MTNAQRIETVDNTISKILEKRTLLDFVRDSLIFREDIPHSEAICYILGTASEGLAQIADVLDRLQMSFRKTDRSVALPELIEAV